MTDLVFRRLDRDFAIHHLPALQSLAADQRWMAWEDANYLHDLPGKWELSRVACHGDNPVGYALCSRKGDVLWLHRLVVSADLRGRGIGETIIGELDRIARAEGFSRIGVKTPAENTGAVRFYERLGFRETAQENGYFSMSRPSARSLITVGIHQPNYLPWLGYFYKMHCSDIFVLLDDVAASKGGYYNRAAVLVQGRPLWLTVPVRRGESRIDRLKQADARWAEKHLRTLETNYRKAPFYRDYIEGLSEIIRHNAGGTLAELNNDLILLVAGWLELGTRVVQSSNFEVEEASDDRLIRLVQLVGGTHYLSGKGGSNYQDPEKFRSAAIELRYSNFKPTSYPQAGAQEFVLGLSVVDALFNIGAQGIRKMFNAAPVPSASLRRA